jgi:hypothetical protein
MNLSSIIFLINVFSNGAKKRNLCWELTLEQWQNLVIGKTCHYCDGGLPEAGCALDRKDSSVGYTINNVVPCCSECNEIKGDNLTYEEMVEIAKLLKALRNKKINPLA